MEITYGMDHLGPAILLSGDLTENTLTGSPLWSKWEGENKSDPRNCWRLPRESKFVRVGSNSPIEYLDILEDDLSRIVANTVHPALTNGFEAEAERLFPGISAEAVNNFVSLVAQLRAQYGIDETLESEKETAIFLDDIGPALFVLVDGQPSILPEIPMVYRAPKEWTRFMWNINNHMVGPLLNEGIGDNQRIHFEGLRLNSKSLSSEQRGIYYFHMARFILTFEAWADNSDTPHLMEFIRLISEEVDPFEKS